ncbi:MAG: sulfatase, partial [Verrucomicrobiae bacterium]|nr:sulfatase [Verrucomicrobiae bacterium]
LFILTDDQGWPTLGCYGNDLVPTPHLDRLAGEGIRFTDAYVTPQCTPTRASLLTGQHTARNGMWHVIGWYGYPWAPLAEPPFVESLPRESFTLAKGLKTAGYATTCIGKWHLTGPEDGNYVALKPESAHYFGFDEAPVPTNHKYHQQGDKGVDWLTGEALKFIEKNRERPWFVYLAHHTIHGPVVAPEETVDKYRKQGAPETGLHNATYLAAIETLDTGVGRLLDGLEALGEKDETLVVFLSDNGGVDTLYEAAPFTEGNGKIERLTVRERQFSNAPLRAGKGCAYEGGIRVPCLVRWPGVTAPGSVSNTPVHVVDWLPTLLAAAGTKAPDDWPIDGVDLSPLLRGGSIAPRSLFWYLPFYELRWGATPSAVIRDGDWKLIESFADSFDAEGRFHPGAKVELFNLRTDLGETRNLAGTEPDRAATMRRRLREWMDSVPATVPGPNPHHDPQHPHKETKIKQPWNP